MKMKLKLSSQKQKKYFRRALLGVLVFLFAMAQNVSWLPRVYGGLFAARALPLLPLVIAIAVYDQAEASIFFAAFAGMLWDVNESARGLHAIYLTAVAFACATLMRYILNHNLLSMGLMTFLASAFYLFIRWFAEYATLGLSPGEAARPLLHYSLPTLGYTLLLAPLCFLSVRAIVRRTSRRQRDVLAE